MWRRCSSRIRFPPFFEAWCVTQKSGIEKKTVEMNQAKQKTQCKKVQRVLADRTHTHTHTYTHLNQQNVPIDTKSIQREMRNVRMQYIRIKMVLWEMEFDRSRLNRFFVSLNFARMRGGETVQNYNYRGTWWTNVQTNILGRGLLQKKRKLRSEPYFLDRSRWKEKRNYDEVIDLF